MAENDPARYINGELQKTIILDKDTLADQQRGYYKKPEFFGDVNLSQAFGNFQQGVQTALGYSGFATSIIDTLVDKRREDDFEFYLTTSEYSAIQKKAKSIAAYGNVPEQTIEDFLIILCSIDKISDMKKISDGIELEELNNKNILRKPFEILEVPKLEKIAFMANALDAFIKLFQKYLNVSNIADSSSESISNIVSNLNSILGGISGVSSLLLEAGSSENALGHFMSEVLEGKRIPMTVIAKNPMKQAPSYIGQAMFGESPTALSLMDLTEVFNKKIGMFPMPSNGSGVSSFGMQNFSSLQGSLNIGDSINKLMFGGTETLINSFKSDLINTVVEKVKVMTGVTNTETFNLNSADVAIPLQISLSAINSGLDKSPFSADTFKKGWQLANGVSNYMQSRDKDFLNIIRSVS